MLSYYDSLDIVDSEKDALKRLNVDLKELDSSQKGKIFRRGFLIENYHIIELSLYDSFLESVPIEILSFKKIKKLDLSKNFITELIDLRALTFLKRIALYGNHLSSFPDNSFLNTTIEIILLASNQIETIPDTVSNFNNLEFLNLNHNKLQYLNSAICDMKSIRRLTLDGNKIECLPSDFGKMKVEILHLSGNQIVELPNSMNQLKTLKIFTIVFNRLKDISSDIFKLPKLTDIALMGNVLNKSDLPEIPKSLTVQI